MMWTLNKTGTFEQNLERVAQAGYHQVELVSEFKNWSQSDMARILARMQALGSASMRCWDDAWLRGSRW